ncbi:MAG: hypothetical protein ACQEQM_04025 [Thermoplasmatota archaeon]
MRKYITLVGKNYWESLNSLWAVIKENKFEPEEVWLVSEKENLRRAKVLKRDFKKLLSNYGFDGETNISLIEDHDGINLGETLQELIEDDDKIALDITGGRKYLVAGSLVNPHSYKFDHVFYVYTGDIDDTDKPLPTIRLHDVTVKDFKAKGNGGEE